MQENRKLPVGNKKEFRMKWRVKNTKTENAK